MFSFNWTSAIFMLLLTAAQAAPAGQRPVPDYIFDENVFETVDGRIIAPRAKHLPEDMQRGPEEKKGGWRAVNDGDYVGFDSDEVFYKDKGTLEIKLVVVDTRGLRELGAALEALVTLYDEAGTPFFAVGINDHDLMVGSFPLHPMIMEDAFGGVGFPYIAKLNGPLKDGAEVTVTVTWGQDPKDDRVYVNGKHIEEAARKGPRNKGNPPGFEPSKNLSTYLDGFKTFDGRVVGPPKTFTIGRIGAPDMANLLSMRTPKSVAIRAVRLSNRILEPSAH